MTTAQRKDQLCFVQFIHPGKEHHPDRDGFKDWNQSGHRRKFLRCNGRRIGTDVRESLHFWAEWEAQSNVLTEINEPLPHGPAFIYSPYYIPLPSYDGFQNTDPFVFGDNFFYTGCQQYTSKGPTQLRYLEKGSVILFGSCVDKILFALDTVFVVRESVCHDARNFENLLENRVSREYMEVTLLPWYSNNKGGQSCTPCDSDQSLRLYWGATPDNPVGEMFSFFPCQPTEQSPRGFSRPIIRIPNLITDNLYQGKKISAVADIRRVEELFACVSAQVEAAHLSLGVYAEMPQLRNDPL